MVYDGNRRSPLLYVFQGLKYFIELIRLEIKDYTGIFSFPCCDYYQKRLRKFRLVSKTFMTVVYDGGGNSRDLYRTVCEVVLLQGN